MTFAETLARWNRWYDALPEPWRFQVLLWPLIAVGTINMALTIATGFPFGLLVLLMMIAAAVVRVPAVMGWLAPVDTVAGGPGPTIRIHAMQWVIDVNRWYDGLPESRRPWVILAVLAVAGVINMVLTINNGFSFGILFLLALLAIVAIRGPYVAGWFIAPAAPQDRLTSPPSPGQIARDDVETAQPAMPVPDAVIETRSDTTSSSG